MLLHGCIEIYLKRKINMNVKSIAMKGNTAFLKETYILKIK